MLTKTIIFKVNKTERLCYFHTKELNQATLFYSRSESPSINSPEIKKKHTSFKALCDVTKGADTSPMVSDHTPPLSRCWLRPLVLLRPPTL